MSREDNEQIRPKKETGLRHPIGKPDYEKNRYYERRGIKEEKFETPDSKNLKKKTKEIGKKISKLTPIGQVKSIVDTIKNITKKDKGIKVNKGDQKSFKVNTGKNLGAGSSNPRRPGAKSGGSICKLAKKGKGRAYGQNS